ncbi:MAG: outer membrane protein assembly factor BamD [Planctomycetota bacterium]|jgi:outer membrane protein assembly factor BamD
MKCRSLISNKNEINSMGIPCAYFSNIFLRMKNIFLIVILAISFASCSEYQKVLSGDSTAKKYAMADSLYTAGKYLKSVRVMEQIIPAYRGKPQGQKLMYLYANAYYNLEDYILASYQFERFTVSYPKSDSVEVAAFKSARSYYKLSPSHSLDQQDTNTALDKLQGFINSYPESDKRKEANEMVKNLREKLDKKAYETANQYLRISDYKAAINAFDNFVTNHPGSEFRKDAFYGRLIASYELAINSLPRLVEERLTTSAGHYNSFKKYYADSELNVEAEKIKEDIDKRLLKIQNPS